MRRYLDIAGVGVAGLLTTNLAVAHHGFGNFDRNREVTIEGTVADIDFVNPHAYVYIDVAAAGGAKVTHRCELRAATVLRRSGWSADMFKNGEPIKVTGAPDRYDANSCYVSTILFADGTTADRYAQLTKPAAQPAAGQRAAHLPSGEPNIFGDWAQEQYVMTDPRGRGGALVPVSRLEELAAAGVELDPNDRPWRTSEVELTDVGRKAADEFDTYTTENPRMRCETTSIIFDWAFDGPVNRISKSGDTITLQYGQLGFTRTIHLNMTQHPANLVPSRAGHSIGRWENDVLVVDTVGFAPGVLSPPVLHSEELHVVERFALDQTGTALTRTYAAEDPVYFKGQYTGSDVVKVADVPYSPDACNELTFLDFSKDGEAPPRTGGNPAPAR